jgi:hypothetical protein
MKPKTQYDGYTLDVRFIPSAVQFSNANMVRIEPKLCRTFVIVEPSMRGRPLLTA